MEDTGYEKRESLLERIAELKEKLKQSEASRKIDSEENSKLAASQQAAAILVSNVTEVPAGTVKIKRTDSEGDVVTVRVQKTNDDGSPKMDEDGKIMYKMEPVYDDVDVFWYKIDLAPSGGLEVKINGVSYFHGKVYKFTLDQLRSVKDIVARSWSHEAQIQGSNENFYRKPIERVLRGGA